MSLTTKERSMNDSFHFFDEPPLSFGFGQIAEDPHDGLALFGPSESKSSLSEHIVIGTEVGIVLWRNWAAALNAPAACVDVTRHRAWPPFPGFDVAFGARWPESIKSYAIDSTKLNESARKADKYERAYSVASLYLEPLSQVQRLDAKPALAICIVPDEVYENCRPRSSVDREDLSDAPKTSEQKRFLKQALRDRQAGQSRMFDNTDARFESILQNLEQYGLSPTFGGS
jgi:hypothetical protein